MDKGVPIINSPAFFQDEERQQCEKYGTLLYICIRVFLQAFQGRGGIPFSEYLLNCFSPRLFVIWEVVLMAKAT